MEKSRLEGTPGDDPVKASVEGLALNEVIQVSLKLSTENTQ